MREADLLLLVGDASHPCRDLQTESVRATLERIGAGGVPRLQVWNKMDIVSPDSAPVGGILVSALTGAGLPDLLAAVECERRSRLDWFRLTLSGSDGRLENWLHENCVMESFERAGEGTRTLAGALMGIGSVRERLADEDPSSWTLEPVPWADVSCSSESGRCRNG